MTWWDAARIERTVTRQFVASHLLPDNIKRLDHTLGFGDGLTDETYWEWIEAKAKRIFLILVDIGIPDQIFGVADRSWDDDDVPFSLQDVERVTAQKDHKLNWKFWDRQFYYILRTVEEGSHVTYGDDEVVPIDILERSQGTTLSQNNHIDRIALPDSPGRVLSRRRLSTSKVPGGLSHGEYLKEIGATRIFRNEHIESYFASYTHLDSIYILTTSAGSYSFKNFLTTAPTRFKALSKQDQNTQIVNWIHCLADALCYLHINGQSYGNVRPSSIIFDSENKIVLADTSNSKLEGISGSSEKTSFNKESYDYAAPEQWFRPTQGSILYGKSSRAFLSSRSSSNHTFSINGSGTDHATLHLQTPQLDPQAADIFSAGCVILEMLSSLLKRTSKSFAAHRGARHKLAGRGGAPLDTSFHKNLGQVESWMTILAKDASKREEPVFRGVTPMLQLVARMLSLSPQDRPNAQAIEQQLYRALTEHCGIAEPHCVHQYEGFGLGLDNLRVSSSDGDAPAAISISTKRRSDHMRSTSGSKRPPSLGSSGYQVLPRTQGTELYP
jgi:serine/threonine protein kinase